MNAQKHFGFGEPMASTRLEKLISDAAKRYPETIALVYRDETISFKELDERSDKLSREILKQAYTETHVAISCTPSLEMMLGVLAILKAGKAFVPLDPGHPQSRLRDMVQDGRFRFALCNASEKDFFIQTGLSVIASDGNYNPPEIEHIERNETAYVIFTSGSTGKPKGVVIGHASIVNYITWAAEEYISEVSENAGSFANLSLAFDASLPSLLIPLCVGKTMVLSAYSAYESFNDPNLLKYAPYDFITLTPSKLNILEHAYDKAAWDATKQYLLIGEALQPWHYAFLKQAGKDAWIINEYGPTEATVACTKYAFHLNDEPKCTGNGISIGKAKRGVQTYILDSDMNPVETCQKGELYIHGIQVADGYLNRPELTAQRFFTDPFSKDGSRMYKTGDMACMDYEGDIEFMGREDDQVKILGNRIETGEIEKVLVSLPQIRQAFVMAREDHPGSKLLTAYLVCEDKQLPVSEITRALEAYLPLYMIPSFFIQMEKLPLNISGKVDRSALPVPGLSRPEMTTLYRAPRTDIEKQICEIWKGLLHVNKIGLDDRFFELGGNSLLAQKCIGILRQKYACKVTIADFYKLPTVNALAQLLDAGTNNVGQRSDAFRNHLPEGREIAVVAMSGRFPGADSVEELWHNLCAGKESIRFFDRSQLDSSIPDEKINDPAYVSARGIMSHADMFDAGFFGINPSMAMLMDPQQRIILELAWELLERANYIPGQSNSRVGVYTGTGNNTYYVNNVIGNDAAISRVGELQVSTLNEKDYVASRIAYHLNLKGPAVSVYSACSTSLLAIAEAVESLRSGLCDIAIAGGSSVTSPIASGHIYQEGAMFSRDGHTRTFDAASSGTVFSDGAALVLLKPLNKAIADGDNILAVIKGIGLNNDGGAKGSFTAPSSEGQAAAISMAMQDAGVLAEEISYIEAHGTGTPLGDPIEIEGLKMAFGEQAANQKCAIGSIKSNIGHLTTAAGVAGLIKTVFALRNKCIPASIGIKRLNPVIDFENSPFYVQTQTAEWITDQGRKRIAGVSSFGVGGTNVHVILEEYEAEPETSDPESDLHLLTWSAKTDYSREQYSAKLSDFLNGHPGVNLSDLAYTLQNCRSEFNHRRFVIAGGGHEGLRTQLLDLPPANQTHTLKARPGEMVFVFPGQGAQYLNMGRELYDKEPVYREAIDTCAQVLNDCLGVDIRQIVFPDQSDSTAEATLKNTRYTQPAIFITEYALAMLWISRGIVPTVLCGHSIGEFVAAHLAGIFNLDDALRLIAGRGDMVSKLPAGSMLSVRAAAAEIQNSIPLSLSLAAVNNKALCVLAGPDEDIAAYAAVLDKEGVLNKRLHTSHAFHSAMMDPAIPVFRKMLEEIKLNKPHTTVISTVSGAILSDQEATDPRYWADHLRKTVNFSDALDVISELDNPLFLEVGPGNVSATLARQQFSGKSIPVIVSIENNTGISETHTMLKALGQLWLHGAEPLWGSLYEGQKRKRIELPSYAFDRSRFWMEPVRNKHGKTVIESPTNKVSEAQNNTLQNTVNTNINISDMRKEALLKHVKELLEDVSGSEMPDFKPSMSFFEIGMDSLLLTQLATVFKKEFQVPVTFRQLYEDLETPGLLVDYLDKLLPKDAYLPLSEMPGLKTGQFSDGQLSRPSGEQTIQELAQQLKMLSDQIATLQNAMNVEPRTNILPLINEAVTEEKSNSTTEFTNISEPPVPGARLGRDQFGEPAWFISDPQSPGKYLQIHTHSE